MNSHSLGIEVKQQQERVNDVLIPKNTPLPTAANRVYRTVAVNQNRVARESAARQAPQAEACIYIGECWIEGLPPNLPQHSPIQVRCSVGTNGLIDVMALDMTSGKMAVRRFTVAAGYRKKRSPAKPPGWAGCAIQ